MDQALIALAAAVLAAAATEWCVRVRERRRKVEEATLELVFLVPALIVPISELWPGTRPDTGVGSEWDQRRERIDSLLVDARVHSYWPLRRHRAIRKEVEDLAARVTAANFDWNQERKPVPAGATSEISGADLMSAVFGGKPYLDESIKYYREHGYGKRPDHL
jgi:hypothetical protein